MLRHEDPVFLTITANIARVARGATNVEQVNYLAESHLLTLIIPIEIT